MSSSSPKLLSFNGRFIWSIHANEKVDGNYFFRSEDLLSEKRLNYQIIGHYSPIGEPISIYWLIDGKEDEMVLIDLKIEGTQKILSQRIFKINYFNCTSVWMGPENRQYTTQISPFSNVLVGEEVVMLIGSYNSNNSQHMLTLPRLPTSEMRSDEISLFNIKLVNLNDTARCSFFFLAKPILSDNSVDDLSRMEPKNQIQKLFYLGELSGGYKCHVRTSYPFYIDGSFSSEGMTPLYCAFPYMPPHSLCFRIRSFAELQNKPNFPPQSKGNDYFVTILSKPSAFEHIFKREHAPRINFLNNGNAQLIPGLFWTIMNEDLNIRRWHLGYLNLLERQWIGPILEWEAPKSEKAQVLMSSDGCVLVLIRSNGIGREKMRCFRMSNKHLLAPPTLLDSILISIQCSDNQTLKLLAQQLMTRFEK